MYSVLSSDCAPVETRQLKAKAEQHCHVSGVPSIKTPPKIKSSLTRENPVGVSGCLRGRLLVLPRQESINGFDSTLPTFDLLFDKSKSTATI